MAGPADFSISSAVALVLGGIAAFVLALVVVLGGYGQGRAKRTALSAEPPRSAAPAHSGPVREAEIEYLLDMTEPTTDTSKP